MPYQAFDVQRAIARQPIFASVLVLAVREGQPDVDHLSGVGAGQPILSDRVSCRPHGPLAFDLLIAFTPPRGAPFDLEQRRSAANLNFRPRRR